MLVKCINKKVTASRTFKKGEKYDVRSHDALEGIAGTENDDAWFEAVSKSESDKFYAAKQKNADVRVKKSESKTKATDGDADLTKQLDEKLAELHLKGEEFDTKTIELDDKIEELNDKIEEFDVAIAATKETKAQ